MRADPNEQAFADYLIELGNGQLPTGDDDDLIQLPEQCIVKGCIIQEMYGDHPSAQLIANTCILCPKNYHVNELNEQIQHKIIPGTSQVYISDDSIESDDEAEKANFPLEYLNSITPSGMPPHKLELKAGSIVMLLRNMNPKRGNLVTIYS